MEGRAILVEAAERAAERNPELAVVMLAEAAHAFFYSGAPEEMLLKKFRLAARHTHTFKDRHAIAKAAVGQRDGIGGNEGDTVPEPGFHDKSGG